MREVSKMKRFYEINRQPGTQFCSPSETSRLRTAAIDLQAIVFADRLRNKREICLCILFCFQAKKNRTKLTACMHTNFNGIRCRLEHGKKIEFYVLRAGRRGRVGKGSFRKSFNDFLVGELEPFGIVDEDPVGMVSGGRCALFVVTSGS